MEEFLRHAFRLKTTPRAGWTRVPGVEHVESVADHTWGVALLALAFAEARPGLDRGRLLTIALAHDLAEAITGDLTPADVSSKEEKRELEGEGLRELLAQAPGPLAERLKDAWEAYETGESAEARLVRDLDKLEMALQADRYAEDGVDRAALAEFRESALAHVRDPEVRALVKRTLDPRW